MEVQQDFRDLLASFNAHEGQKLSDHSLLALKFSMSEQIDLSELFDFEGQRLKVLEIWQNSHFLLIDAM